MSCGTFLWPINREMQRFVAGKPAAMTAVTEGENGKAVTIMKKRG